MVNCIRAGCTEKATHVPKLTVPLAGIVSDKDQPFIAIIPDMVLCSTHVKEVQPSHFQNLKEVFKSKLAGSAVDWNRAEFSGVRTDSAEFKALDK